ncbi:DUF3141 domain-containing protein [Rhizobium hidalgonense]|uniref:Alpha/beta hydrolase n=1 Tax=Rhizobium hidalgonense TaxID=1538159 RepID=A0ABX4JH37_9HYPH|nr:DUF3141 domain-containing protein [Rhizobium hidalgonense]PDT19363.1 alpha/beta hydrolase [Rhizobium hidalgonense]PON04946.1 alpha/beta hydrolase [Rhizobium hidalgonense]
MADILTSLNPLRWIEAPSTELESQVTQSLFPMFQRLAEAGAETAKILQVALLRRVQVMCDSHSTRQGKLFTEAERLAESLREVHGNGNLGYAWAEYLRDASERAILCMDLLRQRGDIFLEHEAAGCPPVFFCDYETVMDGNDLPLKSNYVLLRMIPPQGVNVDDTKRPFIIICPRAGHSPGVGGHKEDSQVGVAFREGHPVYLVSFRREPEGGQYLSNVTYAEAAFVREVMRLHPLARLPVVVGNCQAGWATLLMVATNLDLAGPIILNGSPVTPTSGNIGENTLRYMAGLFGGAWITMFLSDLGGGIFDGAHLVQNFETLNPERQLFMKYVELFRDVDAASEAFLKAEKWWGGFCLMRGDEIRWIVEHLFVGNRLAHNKAYGEPDRRHFDLKKIRAPIIIFASHGDNVTPPQQALNWIPEIYDNEEEIRLLGQHIIYMVHNDVGHLGTFVSSRVINKEYNEVASTLEAIEALLPGLYEMRITDIQEDAGHKSYSVELIERTFENIREFNDGHDDGGPFAAVARVSELQAQIYHTVARPFVQAAVTDISADASRMFHPKRLERSLLSSQNPIMVGYKSISEQVRNSRANAAAENPFLAAEALYFKAVEQAIVVMRDWRDMGYELAFHMIWNNPWQRYFDNPHEAYRKGTTLDDMRWQPDIANALRRIAIGGLADAIIRMVVLLVSDRGGIRRDRLARWSRVLTEDEPFRSLSADHLAEITRVQTAIVTFEPEQAIETLPLLLTEPRQRQLAYAAACYIPGSRAEMSSSTVAMLQRFADVLGQPSIVDVIEDPLAVT